MSKRHHSNRGTQFNKNKKIADNEKKIRKKSQCSASYKVGYLLERERSGRKGKDLEESPGIRAEEFFDLRVLREDLLSSRGMGFVCIRPEEVGRHYSFLALFHFSDPHCVSLPSSLCLKQSSSSLTLPLCYGRLFVVGVLTTKESFGLEKICHFLFPIRNYIENFPKTGGCAVC